MQTLYFDLRDTKGQQKKIDDKIAAAAKLLREGSLVAIPTETVYGLGANGLDGDAVRRIFEAKGRPNDNPLILHVTGPQWLPRNCSEVPPLAYVLARKFWPGPLTMILKRKSVVPDETTAGLDTVAMRCPNHPVTLAIIREAGVVGHGGAAPVPDGVTDAVSVDMGCVGDGLGCTETQVSICAKDSRGPYHYRMVTDLISAARRGGADFAVDIYPHCGSDVEATLSAGHDLRHGLIGPGVYASHGYERSHKKGVENTLKLLDAYVSACAN